MKIRFSEFLLDVDVERTRAFYERDDVKTSSESCPCYGCQNFDKAILQAPEGVIGFLRSLGIDPRKPAEVFDVMGEPEADGTIWYNGWYHICGTISESPAECIDHDYYKKYNHSPDPSFRFEVLPIAGRDLVHKEFPTPVIQLEINTHLPYLLNERSS